MTSAYLKLWHKLSQFLKEIPGQIPRDRLANNFGTVEYCSANIQTTVRFNKFHTNGFRPSPSQTLQILEQLATEEFYRTTVQANQNKGLINYYI